MCCHYTYHSTSSAYCILVPTCSGACAQALRPATSGSKSDPVQRIARKVQAMLLLKEALAALPDLAAALEPAESELLKAVRACSALL